MAKVMIEVEVEVSGKPGAKPEEYTFVGVKLPGQQQCPLPKDAPAPRRFVNDLALAAGNKLAGVVVEKPAEKPKAEPPKSGGDR